MDSYTICPHATQRVSDRLAFMAKWQTKAKAGLKTHGLTYLDVANKLGVTEGAVSHYLNGKREPAVHQIQVIAQMIDTTLTELCDDDALIATSELDREIIQVIKQIAEEDKEAALKMLKGLSNPA